MGHGIIRPQPDAAWGQPRQAVILAGGRGHRLSPVSDLRPKPMAALNGRPFLEHLLLDLSCQGIQEFVFLVGYQAEKIIRHFGDGSEWNVAIKYSQQPVETGTGARLRRVTDWLDSHFLLTYADNLCPLDLEKMWDAFSERESLAQITVYGNRDGYTRSNVKVVNGRVERYASDRQGDDLNGVDIGYVLCRHEVVDLLSSEPTAMFQDQVYGELSERGQLAAYVTEQRYYSIGSPGRLAETERYLSGPPTVLIDRDGVLNAKMPRAEYVESWDDWQWLPGSLDALRMLKQAHLRVILVTNQAGVARGMMTRQAVDEIHARMAQEVENAGGYIDAIYVCDHGWDDECVCRKPRPGMLIQAQRDFGFSLRDTPYVGDDERDAQAATAAGCPFVPIGDNFQLIDAAPSIITEYAVEPSRFATAGMPTPGS